MKAMIQNLKALPSYRRGIVTLSITSMLLSGFVSLPAQSQDATSTGEVNKRTPPVAASSTDTDGKKQFQLITRGLASGPAEPIEAGVQMEGSLAMGDLTLEDGSYYDLYTYEGKVAEQLSISLASGAFNTYLIIGQGAPEEVVFISEDDDGSGGSDALLEVILPEDETYTIFVTSNARGAQGPYTLLVESAGQPPAISADQETDGRLEEGDHVLPTFGSYYDLWIYEGQQGERVTITMRSDEFESYLWLAYDSFGPEPQWFAQSDISEGNLDAQVQAILPEDGLYIIMANSIEVTEGRYAITLHREPPVDYAEMYRGNGDPSERYALLIGISDYPGTENDLFNPEKRTSGAALDGPVADAQAMRQALLQLGYKPENIIQLLNEDAHREHIVNAFLRHLGQAGPGGTALFFYAGHGIQMDANYGIGAPVDPEDGDRKDESLYVWGHNKQTSVLLDDEIGYLADQLDTQQIVLIVDACNSGSGSRARTALARQVDFDRVRDELYIPTEFITRSLVPSQAAVRSSTSDLIELLSTKRQPHVLLAGSTDEQFSYQAENLPGSEGYVGVFTHFLLLALENADRQATMAELFEQVQQEVSTYVEREFEGAEQSPQISGELSEQPITTFFLAR